MSDLLSCKCQQRIRGLFTGYIFMFTARNAIKKIGSLFSNWLFLCVNCATISWKFSHRPLIFWCSNCGTKYLSQWVHVKFCCAFVPQMKFSDLVSFLTVTHVPPVKCFWLSLIFNRYTCVSRFSSPEGLIKSDCTFVSPVKVLRLSLIFDCYNCAINETFQT